MKVSEVIMRFNRERPNNESDDMLLGWLKKLERLIIEEIILRHDLLDLQGYDFNKHLDTFEMDTEALVPDGWDDVYIDYLDMRVGAKNGEAKKYNQSASKYNNSLMAFQSYWTRHHMPVQPRKHFLDHSRLEGWM